MQTPLWVRRSGALLFIALMLAAFYTFSLFDYMAGDLNPSLTPAQQAENKRAERAAIANFCGSWLVFAGVAVYGHKQKKRKAN